MYTITLSSIYVPKMTRVVVLEVVFVDYFVLPPPGGGEEGGDEEDYRRIFLMNMEKLMMKNTTEKT